MSAPVMRQLTRMLVLMPLSLRVENVAVKDRNGKWFHEHYDDNSAERRERTVLTRSEAFPAIHLVAQPGHLPLGVLPRLRLGP